MKSEWKEEKKKMSTSDDKYAYTYTNANKVTNAEQKGIENTKRYSE